MTIDPKFLKSMFATKFITQNNYGADFSETTYLSKKADLAAVAAAADTARVASR